MSVMRKLRYFCTYKVTKKDSPVVLQAIDTDVFPLKPKEL